MYSCCIKRFFDIVLSLIAIIVLAPVFLIIAIAVRISMGKPISFTQERIGKDEKIFKLSKFRSMTDAKDQNGELLPEEKRHTKFGDALRSSSLDELPELFMILKGDMSFVGPRPLPTYYGPYFHEDEKIRHSVRGGLIPPDGLCGETTPDWETQFKYDVYYARNVSFVLDIKIIIATFKILFKRVTGNYGSENRPHLNEYRATEKTKEKAINELSTK